MLRKLVSNVEHPIYTDAQAISVDFANLEIINIKMEWRKMAVGHIIRVGISFAHRAWTTNLIC